MPTPRLIQSFLLDGTLEGIRILELSESSIKAFVVPRIKIGELNSREEIKHPSLYLLINSGDNQIYIGESENFLHRIRTHDQDKNFWDTAVAIVSNTNSLGKSDVKYLESLAVEKAKETAAMEVLNKTVPVRNNIHEFHIHSLNIILDDVEMLVESLGFSIFTSKQNEAESIWYANAKKSTAKAQFRGDKFVVLSGSIIDKSFAPSLKASFPQAITERDEIFKKFGKDLGDKIELLENIPFKSPNHAGGFVTGRMMNAWITWKNSEGKTMDEVMRKN